MSVHVKQDGRVFVITREHGRYVWESFGRGPEALATARARDLELQLGRLRGEDQHGMPRESPSFGAIAQQYINARQTELSDHTRGEILRLLSRPQLAKLLTRPIRDVHLSDWQDIQNRYIERGTGNRSINCYFRYLNPIMAWAVQQQIIPANPWRDRTSLRQKKFHIDLMSIEEFNQLIAAAPDHLAWAMVVAYHTGMRPGPSELYAATWDHVDWPNRRIHIWATKTKHWRWQYLSKEFMRLLKSRYARYQEKCGVRQRRIEAGADPATIPEIAPNICVYRNKPIINLKVSLAESVARAGITKHIRLYDIRHLHITHALAGGAAIGELAERVGHTTPQMIVNVYSHMVEEIRSKRAFAIPKISPLAKVMPKSIRQVLDKGPKKGVGNHA